MSSGSGLSDSLSGSINLMDTRDLEELIDDSALDRLIEGDSELNELKLQKAAVHELNKLVAQQNLRKRSKLEDGCQRLVELHSSVRQLQDELRWNGEQLKRSRTINDHDHRVATPQDLCDMLQSASLEAEEASGEKLQLLLDSNLSLTDFVHQYFQLRCKYHSRRVKAEKMDEICKRMVLHRSPFA